MDIFSLRSPKSSFRYGPIIHRPTYPGMKAMMENQNESAEWNKRWRMQILEWHLESQRLMEESRRLMEEAEALTALIKLAQSQIQRDPPE